MPEPFPRADPCYSTSVDICFFYLKRINSSTPFMRLLIRAGHVARMGTKRNKYGILVGKPEGRRPLGRPRRRWADIIER
jgi:hypothetical protein